MVTLEQVRTYAVDHTIKESSVYFHLSQSHLYRLSKKYGIKFKNPHDLYDTAEFQEYLRTHSVKDTAKKYDRTTSEIYKAILRGKLAYKTERKNTGVNYKASVAKCVDVSLIKTPEEGMEKLALAVCLLAERDNDPEYYDSPWLALVELSYEMETSCNDNLSNLNQ